MSGVRTQDNLTYLVLSIEINTQLISNMTNSRDYQL